MSKHFSIPIEAGCRIGGIISNEAQKKQLMELFDVLEVMSEGKLRCHQIGTRFRENRNIMLEEHQLTWCRLSDGREFSRTAPEDPWQDSKPLTGT